MLLLFETRGTRQAWGAQNERSPQRSRGLLSKSSASVAKGLERVFETAECHASFGQDHADVCIFAADVRHGVIVVFFTAHEHMQEVIAEHDDFLEVVPTARAGDAARAVEERSEEHTS